MNLFQSKLGEFIIIEIEKIAVWFRKIFSILIDSSPRVFHFVPVKVFAGLKYFFLHLSFVTDHEWLWI